MKQSDIIFIDSEFLQSLGDVNLFDFLHNEGLTNHHYVKNQTIYEKF